MLQFPNVKIETKGKQLIITIENYDAEQGLSASSKSQIVASTGGNQPVPGTEKDGKPVIVGLNVYRKA